VDLSHTPELVTLSLNYKPMEEYHEEEPEEEPELGEPQTDHDMEDAESSILNNSFDSSKEPMDGFDLDYDPSRDC